MDQVKTWTVEEIEDHASAFEANVHKCRVTGYEARGDAYQQTADLLRAFAAQTRQVEEMREWLERQDAKKLSPLSPTAALSKFAELFPKGGARPSE